MGSGGSLLRHRGLSSALAFVMAMVTFVVAGTPKIAQAASVTVCLPSNPASPCDYSSVEAAVNDETRIDGDVVNLLTDAYVLTATLQIDYDVTIYGNSLPEN